MSLRLKTLIILVLGFLVVTVGGYFLTRQWVLRGFDKHDEHEARATVLRVTNFISSDLATLSATTKDWASWDDTYEFLKGARPDYARVNLVESTYQNLRLHFIAIFDTAGNTVYAQSYDLGEAQYVPVPPELRSHLQPESLLLSHQDTTGLVEGILPLSAGPLLVVSRPVLTSTYEGPVAGTFIFGRYLGAAEVQRVSDAMLTPLLIQPLSSPDVPPDFHKAASTLRAGADMNIRPLDDKMLGGYTLLSDIYGQPAYVLRVETFRHARQQGLRTVNVFGLGRLIGLLLLGVGSIVLLDRFVLARVARLSASVSAVGASGDLASRLPVTDKRWDELSRLRDSINGMLEALERSQRGREEDWGRYRAIIDQAREGIALVDPKTQRVLETNAAFQKLTGYSEQELKAMPVYDFVAMERDVVDQALQRVLFQETQSSTVHQRQYRRKDGSTVLVEGTTNLVMHAGAVSICVVVRDITERKRAEEALRRRVDSERLLAAISASFVNAPPEGLDGRIQEALQALGSFAGTDRSYVFLFSEDGKRMDNTHEWCADGIEPQRENLQALPVETFPWFMEKLRHSEAVLVPRVAELPTEAKPERDILEAQSIKSAVIVPLVFGRSLRGFLGFDAVREERQWSQEDATLLKVAGNIVANALEAKRSGQALERLRRQNELILRSAGEGIIGVDAHGIVVFANPAAARLTGYGEAELVGKDLHQMVHHSRHDGAPYPKEECPVGIVLRQGGVRFAAGEVFWRKDGASFPVEYASASMEEGDARVGAVVVFNEEARLQFLNALSHELRTPLTPIRASAGMLREIVGNGPDSTAERLLRNIMAGVETLRSRIDDLVDVGAFQAGMLQLRLARFDTKRILEQTCDGLRPVAEQRHQSILLEAPSELPRIRADSSRVQQVLTNLLLNALKFSRDGQQVAVRASTQEAALVVEVEDHGIGISCEDQGKLFQPYFQVKGKGSGARGLGLGLVLSSQIVQAHGGRIWVESELGKGSVFRFSLPVDGPSRRRRSPA
ncbi:MAG: PAS domain S-box protein [Chloroflexi bacterium]|nr:PAS domain S-box protein [Chloroflexota bacterium]